MVMLVKFFVRKKRLKIVHIPHGFVGVLPRCGLLVGITPLNIINEGIMSYKKLDECVLKCVIYLSKVSGWNCNMIDT